MNKKTQKGSYLEILLRSPKTVFTTKDIALLWGEEMTVATRVRLSSYVKKGKLIHVHRGIYAKDKNYNRLELATRVYTPSYISFETVLTRSGINFQYYNSIFVASYVSRERQIDDHHISYIRMKDHVLTDTTGIIHADEVPMATKERAFLDRMYVSAEYHFDHLDILDWENVFDILPIYKNERMNKKVATYFADYKKQRNI